MTGAGQGRPGVVRKGGDEAWRNKALCALVPVDQIGRYFFPPGCGSRHKKDMKKGLAICAECPSRVPCREYALANKEEFGTWGGLTEWDRRGTNNNQTRTRYTKTCLYCEKEYQTTQTVQDCCSRRCSSLFQSKRRKEARRQLREQDGIAS